MPARLPFDVAPDALPDGHSGAAAASCPIHGLLAPELREQAEANPHLMTYLHRVPMAEFGVPEYYPEINRKMGDLKEPNLIYPVGQNTFIHIYPETAGDRNWYVAIEPGSDKITDLIEQMEFRLLDFVEILAEAHEPEEKTAVLLKAIDDSCDIIDGEKPALASAMPNVDPGEGGFLKLPFASKSAGGAGGGKLRVTAADYNSLRYMVIRDKVGMGPLEPLISDNWIEDISCSGIGPVYIEHKVFKGLKSSINFDTHEELAKGAIFDLLEQLRLLDARIDAYDEQIHDQAKLSEPARRLMQIRGIGATTALAIVATVGNAREFKNGRQFAAWIGLVPGQYSTGGKSRLGHISKRGDAYLRNLLVQGARSVLQTAPAHADRLSRWALELQKRRGYFRALVAIANKNARIAWVLLAKEQTLRSN